MNARRYGALLIAASIAGALNGCHRAPGPPAPKAAAAPAPASNGWANFRDDFLDAYFKAEPALAVSAGRHEFDGQLPDWSANGIAHEIARLHAVRERTAEFRDSTLSAA